MTTALAESRSSNGSGVPQLAPPRLPYHPAVEERFGIDRASWKALVEAIFPSATTTESIILALSYCRARKLDPFKRNVHIVPIWDKDRGGYVDTVWPGIGELRTTAFRTGEYAGRDAATFGPDKTQTFAGTVGRRGQERHVEETVTFPEWAQVTVYRVVHGQRVAFAGPVVYWLETYSTQGRSEVPNEMWRDRPRGQIEKCAEAAALRAAFPEEIGSEYITDEVRGDRVRPTEAVATARPVDALNARLTQRPVSEGQTCEPDPTYAAQAEGDATAPGRAHGSSPTDPGEVAGEPAPSFSPGPVVDGADAEPAPQDDPLFTLAESLSRNANHGEGVPLAAAQAAVAKWAKLQPKKKLADLAMQAAVAVAQGRGYVDAHGVLAVRAGE